MSSEDCLTSGNILKLSGGEENRFWSAGLTFMQLFLPGMAQFQSNRTSGCRPLKTADRSGSGTSASLLASEAT